MNTSLLSALCVCGVVLAAHPGLARAGACNAPKAPARLKASCDGGKTRDCYQLGVCYQTGAGVKQDFKQAFRLFRRACTRGGTYGCNGLGRLYQQGRGVKRDIKRALQFYDKACTGKDGFVCAYLGVLYETGNSVKRNQRKALSYYRKACALKQPRGCQQVGLLGRGRKAKAALTFACDHKQQLACARLRWPPFADRRAFSGAAGRVQRELKQLLASAQKAMLTAASGNKPGRFLHPSEADVRTTAAIPGVTPGSLVQATMLHFEWTQQVSAPSHANLGVMAYLLPKDSLRWLFTGQTVSGRSTRAMISITPYADKAPGLWRAVQWPFDAVRIGGCSLGPRVAPGDLTGLPAALQAEARSAGKRYRQSCQIVSQASGGRWLFGLRWIAVVVKQAAGSGHLVLFSKLKVDKDGRLWLGKVTAKAM
jgi:Sel1 repeat